MPQNMAEKRYLSRARIQQGHLTQTRFFETATLITLSN